MNIFSTLQNPMTGLPAPIDRTFTLYSANEDRTGDRSATTARLSLGAFPATEPQQIQRVTTNLLSVGDPMLAMQMSAFKVFTGPTDLTFRKGQHIEDQKTGKHYRVVSTYQKGLEYDLMVTELDD